MERLQHQFHALGSTVLLTIVHDQEAVAASILTELQAQIVAFEQRFSRFKEDSELTAFNRRAGQRVSTTPSFRALLGTARDYAEKTNGLYNPFILPVLQGAGYRSSWPDMQAPTAIDFSQRHMAAIGELIIGDDWASIPAGTALDFGGIGKGYLLDQLNEWLLPKRLEGYWLSLGGDILCAGHDLKDALWQVGVQDAAQPDQSIATITNHTGEPLAIATSGITKRQGAGWHHIIDPRTGLSAATDLLTATVATSSGVMADIAAKTIIIAGEAQAKRYKAADDIQGYILQTRTGTRSIGLRDLKGA